MKTITLRMNGEFVQTNISIGDEDQEENSSCPNFDKLKELCGNYFAKVHTYVQSFKMKYHHDDDFYTYTLLDDENVKFMFQYFRKKVKENSNFMCTIVCEEDSVEKQIVEKLIHKYSKIIERRPIYTNREKQVWIYRVKSNLVVKVSGQMGGVEYDSEVWKEVKRTKEYSSHPLIIKIGDIFSFKVNDILHVAYEMKYYENGTLQNVISNKIELSEMNIVFIMIQIGLVLGYIQQKNKGIHRDIRLANIFIDSIISYEAEKLYRITVADFECVTYENNASIFSLHGAQCYAPEVKESGYSFSSDVFTLGVLLFQLMTCYGYGTDFFSCENYQEKVKEILIEKNCFSHVIKNLVISMIEREPQKRPSISSIIREGRLYFEKYVGSECVFLFELLKNICDETEDCNAQYNLGYMYDIGKGFEQDYLKAIEYYQLSANQGHSTAQFNLGVMYANGKGVEQDYLKSIEYFQLSANQGNSTAQLKLGYMYSNGKGVEQDYLKAIEYFQLSANHGNSNAQFNLGVMYANGNGVEQDYLKSIEYYQLSANQGHSSAQFNLGNMYSNGNGVEQDYLKSIEYYQLSANQGNSSAQLNLGYMYDIGNGVEQDYLKAIEYFKLSANQGHSDAQFNLGVMYANGKGVEQDYLKAIEYYQLSANQGHSTAQFNLGYMYDIGNGVEQDYLKAIEYYQLSANQGHSSAQFNLGNMYSNGNGVEQDYLKSIEYYQLSANQGNSSAQLNLGYMYDIGNGVEQDYLKAIEYFKLSANQGHSDAQFNLGVMYANGKGVEQDYLKSIEYYQLSANQGHSNAQFNLGVMYANGNGVEQDYLKAIEYYQLSANQGNSRAQKQLENMNNQNRTKPEKLRDCIIS